MVHALNSCEVHETEKQGEELRFSVVLPWIEQKKKGGTRIDMDINRSRYLQKCSARCSVLYLSSQILKTKKSLSRGHIISSR